MDKVETKEIIIDKNLLQMKQISNSRKLRKIRDVVHDYVEITSIENDIINTKEFQRLRYICQNSLAYYTYPSNTTNRFSHSLGVMHIGGLLFTKALENSNKTDLLEFLGECEKFIETVIEENNTTKDLFNDWINLFGNVSDFNHHPSDLTDPEWFKDKKSLAVINIMWQSVRIACLVHDIGHFPFSHLFEHSLEDFTYSNDGDDLQKSIKTDILDQRRKYRDYYKTLLKLDNDINLTEEPALHEVKGVLILREFQPIRELKDTRKRELTLLCLKLAKIVFIHNKSSFSDKLTNGMSNIVESLHSIVSSEIDADRLDYCMRDPNASGIELGAYDLKRIVDSSVLIKSENRFKIVFSLNGSSGIEAFFHQRFLMYEYLIYHHNVARFDASLEKTISLILNLFSYNEIVKEVALSFGLIKSIKDQKFSLFDSIPFYNYDDYWFKTFLNQLYHRLEKEENESGDIDNLICLLEIVLFRNNNNVFSYWKRPFDFDNDLELVKTILDTKNQSLSKEDIVKRLNILTDSKSEKAKKNIEELRETLLKKGVYLLIKSVKKKIFATEESKRVEILCSNGQLKPAYEVSPYLKSLKINTENSIGFNLFIVGNNIKQNNELLLEVKNDLINQFVNIIIN